MKLEKFITCPAGDVKVYNISRGRFTGLLFNGVAGFKTKIKLVLRTSKRNYVILNGVQANQLQDYSALTNKSVDYRTSGADYMNYLGATMYYAYNDPDAVPAPTAAEKTTVTGIKQFINKHLASQDSFIFDFGHISLVGDAELELTIDCGQSTDGITCYGYTAHQSSDYIRMWDNTQDSDSYHHKVLEVIDVTDHSQKFVADGVDSLGITDYKVAEVDYQIDSENKSSLFDLKGAIAHNNLMSTSWGEFEVISLYKSTSMLGDSLRVKVTGYSAPNLIFIKYAIPDTVSYATVEALKEEREKISKLSEAEQQRARHAGIIDGKLGELDKVIRTLETRNEQKEIPKP